MTLQLSTKKPSDFSKNGTSSQQKQGPIALLSHNAKMNVNQKPLDDGANKEATNKRPQTQRQALQKLISSTSSKLISNGGLEYRYRKYQLPNIPSQPDWPGSDGSGAEQKNTLYLFNVLVALEWYPNKAYILQLRRAFRSASDFLYDVTDGQMAFGQVILGGTELMDYADIQIMASNRVHPRSSKEGLFDPERPRSIRIGRALWHQRQKVSIPWDEPQGYRALIHEWGHYALGLHDQYLASVEMNDNGSRHKLVIPTSKPNSRSFMSASIWSELDLEEEKEMVQKMTSHFPDLEAREYHGPERLPLSLPRFDVIGTLRQYMSNNKKVADRVSLPSIIDDPDIEAYYNRCWLYLLRDGGKVLVPQGTLDILREKEEANRCRVLGAKDKDRMLLVADLPALGLLLFESDVSCNGSHTFESACWKGKILANPPIISLMPTMQPNQIRLSIKRSNKQTQPKTVRLFSLTGSSTEIAIPTNNSQWLSEPIDLPTLHGHILAEWANGKTMIYSFSQGGDPEGHSGVNAPPVTAGSADGNVMLFFEELSADAKENNSKDLNIITTLTQAGSRDEQQGSHIYSLASNKPLPQEYSPTLVLYYDNPSTGPGATYDHKPILRRLADDGRWQELPESYARAGNSFVAIPLTGKTAPKLTEKHSASASVESYQLYWKPMTATA